LISLFFKGLTLLKFDETDDDKPNPEVSLISLGAELIMLSIETFLKYANDNVRDNIRQIIQPYPQTNDMQVKLQNYADWEFFKKKALNALYNEFEQKRNLKSKFPIK
jgi:hypothetical protein